MLKTILENNLSRLGIPASSGSLDRLSRYAQLLVEWNKKMNLVSRSIMDKVETELLLDSLVPFAHNLISPRATCLDIGTGAGIPGLILAMVAPSLRVSLIDSIRKKTLFLKKAVKELGLDNVSVYQGRAEQLSEEAMLKGSQDLVLFKAFDTIKNCLGIARPFLLPSGKIIMYKGPQPGFEIEEAKAEFPDFTFSEISYLVPGSNKRRNLVVASLTLKEF